MESIGTNRVALSKAEAEILDLLTSGHTADKELASLRRVADSTHRSQMRVLYLKTGCFDRCQLILWALRNGFPRSRSMAAAV